MPRHMVREEGGMRPSERYPVVNLNDPQTFAAATQNVVNLHDATPHELRAAGMSWYGDVHHAVERGTRGTSLSHEQGSAIVAAVSPGMDFEEHNIQALHDIHKLKKNDWKTISDSAARGGQRTPEAASVLRKVPSLSRSLDPQLVKAHRIMEGEDPDEVLARKTAPKTNSFFHNIARPDVRGPVTIDGRAHDIAAGRMTPWSFSGRGISSAQAATGRPTRYELMEHVYRGAAEMRDMEFAHDMQAVTWVGGKHIETSAPTKSGRPRVKGVARHGQPYLP